MWRKSLKRIIKSFYSINENQFLAFLIYKFKFIMNKKFLSAVLFGALLASTTGTFTSCKDYDDDINGLSERVDAIEKHWPT